MEWRASDEGSYEYNTDGRGGLRHGGTLGQRDPSGDLTPVIRVGLKRVNLVERVLDDDELRCSPFARLVGNEILQILLADANGRRFADGLRIFLEADPGDSLFLLLKGQARLTVGAGA